MCYCTYLQIHKLMTSDKLIIVKNRIKKALSAHRLNAAFDELETMAASIGAPWSMRDEIARLRSGYDYMVHYALDGVSDPSRREVFDDIVSGIGHMADTLIRYNEKRDSPRLYFSALRYEEMQEGSSLVQLLALYRKNADALSLALMGGRSDIDNPGGESLVKAQERLARRIFNLVWVTYPMSVDDEDALSQLFKSDVLPRHFKQLVLSAIMLGALEYYDERRMVLLTDLYIDQDGDLGVMALCALLLAMWCNRLHISGRRFMARLGAAQEKKGWADDVKMVFLQFIRTRDTERINRTMKEEIFPEMMKLRPDIYKKIKDAESIDALTEADYNPEWEDILSKSGIADKIREISELQADGGDVMMSTFAHLKTFPFFNEVANWFLPYYAEQSDVTAAMSMGFGNVLNEVIGASPFLCSSDKYSMVFSIGSIPDAQRKMLTEQFRAQNVNLAELQNSELFAENKNRENVANKYIQDLYRFFKLFRRKCEFNDPFVSPINLIEIPNLAPLFNDGSTLNLVAEFYFKRGYYKDALSAYVTLLEDDPSSPQLLQKAGYCYQKEGDISAALALYERAEFVSPDSIWTLRRLAMCHKLQNDPKRALHYFQRIAELKPDDLGVALNIGHCNMELGNYEEALKQYFKVEFLDGKSSRAWRPIAWCAFLSGDYTRSRDYFVRILSSTPEATDYLNMGHLELASGNYREASRLYARSIMADNGDVKSFEASMRSDAHILADAGVDDLVRDIVIDNAIRDVII